MSASGIVVIDLRTPLNSHFLPSLCLAESLEDDARCRQNDRHLQLLRDATQM
jgi:hypothetical protein